MLPRLFLDTLVGVDNDERRIGSRGAGHHVADEFPMAWCVDQHVLAAWLVRNQT